MVFIAPSWDFLGYDGRGDDLFEIIASKLKLQERWSEGIQRLERSFRLRQARAAQLSGRAASPKNRGSK